MLLGFFILFASAVASYFLTFGVRKAALRFSVLAKQDSRRRHDRPVPLLGGSAFIGVLSLFTLICWLAPGVLGFEEITTRSALSLLSAFSLIYLVGAIDDWTELRAPAKFAAQFGAALLVLFSSSELPPAFAGWGEWIPEWLVAVVLVFWVVGITNAVNMIDGLDGLCAGVTGLSAFTLAMIMVTVTGNTQSYPLVLSLALAGCCLGFLGHNFNPARIFLGDSGSLLLGFVLAVISVKLEVKRSLMVSMSLPLFLLGLPLIDIVLSMIRRGRKKRSLFRGDRSHLHHRLQQLGLSQKSAVIFLWCIAAYLNLVAFFLSQVPVAHSAYIYALVVPTIGFWFASLYFIERRLSLQNAKFGQLLLKRSVFAADRSELTTFVERQVVRVKEDGKLFTVLVLDCDDLLKQMGAATPSRIVEFYVRLYGILKGRLRTTDLVARVSDTRIVAVLEGTDGHSELSLVRYLMEKVRVLQEEYGVFQGDPRLPEGFRTLHYPAQVREIMKLLGTEPAAPTFQPDSNRLAG
jgi:UDP-GlcNAc:undecaprenyl-phosphate/decaprenyl-phosphate GlcNAc-1-phosphate transferase